MNNSRCVSSAPPTKQLADPEPEHLNHLEDFLSRVLASELVESIFAQVIDGIPTAEAFKRSTATEPDLPQVLERKDLAADSVQRYRELRAELHLGSLQIASKVGTPHAMGLIHTMIFWEKSVQAFQDTLPSSDK